jgi:UDP-glucose 4-epimerase
MKVLITGASGFIGRNFLIRCPKGWDVYAIYNNSKDFPEFLRRNKMSHVTPIKSDLTVDGSAKDIMNKTKVDGFDVCYHFAATTPFSVSEYTGVEDVKMIFMLNELFSDRRIKRFVFPSSYIVYGQAEKFPIKETAPLSPTSLYGANKAVCEKFLKAFLTKHNIPFVFLRASCVMSEFQTHGIILSFIEKAARDEEISIYDEEEKRDNIYLDDFIGALIITSQTGSGVYNIGSGESYTIKDIAHMIIEQVGSGTIKILNKGSKLSDNLLDISKAKNVFGFAPKTSIEKALSKIIQNRGMKYG